MHQAGFSPRHQRDSRAGTTILHLVSASDDRTKALISDYGPAGLPEQGQRRSIHRGRRTALGTTGRTEQWGAAAELSVPQDLCKDYGPTESS